MEILSREFIYIWYYFTVQLEQIFGWWVLGMVIGSAVSVFAKDSIHRAFRTLNGKRLGVLGIAAASALGIASPLCMYGTIPIAASISEASPHNCVCGLRPIFCPIRAVIKGGNTYSIQTVEKPR